MPRKNLISLDEAIVIALIKKPSRTANLEDIAKYIDERNLYPERKGNVSLAKQIMLRSTKSKGAYYHLFENIGAGFIRLKDTNANFSMLLYSALEEMLDPYKNFFSPTLLKLKVVDPEWGKNRNIEINPKEVVCITSKGTGRKKTIYLLEPSANGEKVIKKYTIHKNLIDLRNQIDSLSRYYFKKCHSECCMVQTYKSTSIEINYK